MNKLIEFRNKKFNVYCGLFKTEISQAVAQPTDSDIEKLGLFIEKHPERKRTMIDVGAHIGLFSIIYSDKFDKIYSYEPNKKSYDYLIKNINENNCDNIIPKNYCISNDFEHGEMVSFGSPDNSGTFVVKENPDGDVKCVRLDDYDFEFVDFIKIDVEGCELTVLQSAENLLRKFKPFLQIEVCSKEVLNFLTKLNYKIFYTRHDTFLEYEGDKKC